MYNCSINNINFCAEKMSIFFEPQETYIELVHNDIDQQVLNKILGANTLNIVSQNQLMQQEYHGYISKILYTYDKNKHNTIINLIYTISE